MDKELTQEELMNIRAGIPVGMVSQSKIDSTELSLDDLDNVFAGPNREAMDDQTLEHSKFYNEQAIDALVEEKIKEEERLAALDSQSYTRNL